MFFGLCCCVVELRFCTFDGGTSDDEEEVGSSGEADRNVHSFQILQQACPRVRFNLCAQQYGDVQYISVSFAKKNVRIIKKTRWELIQSAKDDRNTNYNYTQPNYRKQNILNCVYFHTLVFYNINDSDLHSPSRRGCK